MSVLVSTLLLAVGSASALPLPPADVPAVGDLEGSEGIPFQPSDDDLALSAPATGEIPPSAYIVNGEPVPDTEFQEVVYLEIEGLAGNESLCTGSLIHPEWVLTAAHCVDGNPAGITVHVGSEFPGEQHPASQWWFHEDWQENAEDIGDFQGDVAVVRLATPVDDVFVMALNEVPMDETWLGQDIRFIGFGITEWKGGGSGVKRTALEPITNVPERRPYLVNVWSNGDGSTCQGDSGGPGIIPVGSGYTQVTVTSHGVECGRGPGGHMRVDHFLEWIRDEQRNQPNTFDSSSTKPAIPVITAAAAPPSFVCNRRLDETDDASVSLGVVPFDLTCGVVYNHPDEITDVTWDWGDGTSSEVDDSLYGVHTYENGGRYTVRMCAEGLREGAEDPWNHCVTRSSLVRSCGLPNVQFDIEATDPLTYTFRNRTSLSDSYLCVFDVQWDFYEGSEVTGEPAFSLKTWEPTYTFETTGEYTAVLNVGGLAGTAAAKATFNVTRAGAGACSHLGGAGLGLLGLGLTLVATRRRR